MRTTDSTEILPSTAVAIVKVVAKVGQTGLANRIGGRVKQGHVWTWINRDHKAPPEHCLAIQRVAYEEGVDVTVHDLRPDVFGDRQQEDTAA